MNRYISLRPRAGLKLAGLILLLLVLISACIPTPVPGGPTPTPYAKACNGLPPPCYLTRKGLADATETGEYYDAIDPAFKKRTFAGWLSENGFSPTGAGDVRAIYYNAGDLNIGRDMNCKQSGGSTACYVSNYGPQPGTAGFPDANKALNDATAHADGTSGDPLFTTVAMESQPGQEATFYVFQPNGQIATAAALDSEGPKSVPQICLNCHGGTYDSTNNTVTGGSFLPFDVFSFQYSQKANWTQSDQQEAFRKLNAIVRATNPNSGNANDPIVQLIDGMYSQGVNTPTRAPIDTYVPPGWNAQRGAYLNFVTPYCRGCHIANNNPTLDFTKHSDFRNLATQIINDVCRAHNMPHAEVPFQKMWALGLSPLVLDDPAVLPSPRLRLDSDVTVNESDFDVDKGIVVQPNDLVTISASGEIDSGLILFGNNGPNGFADSSGSSFPLPGSPSFGLIGKLDGGYFVIGENLTFTHTGQVANLLLRTNDDAPGNGSGAFQVHVTISRLDPSGKCFP